MKAMKKLFMALIACTMVLSSLTFVPAKAETIDRVEEILSNMTLDQKLNQMMMVDFRKWQAEGESSQTDFTVMNDEVREIVEKYNFGSIIYFANNSKETKQIFDLTLEYQKASTANGGIPTLFTIDQEGGRVNRIGSGTKLPGNMSLGASDVKYSNMAGQIIGSELISLGINSTLAPVVDVNNNPNNPVIGTRSFSDNAVSVGEHASAYIAGLAEYDVIGCAKHFPGHGDTATDSHTGLPVVDKPYESLKEVELKPYEVAIEQGIEMIMTAHILYPQLDDTQIKSNKTGELEYLPATMSKKIINDMLKNQMGFDGVVTTDAMNMAGVADKWDRVQSITLSINAGVDLICMPVSLTSKASMVEYDAVIDGLKENIENGTISMDRIDDAVTRILTLKESKNILDWSEDDYSLDKALATVGGKENKAMEREIAAAGITVVKNDNNVLPVVLNKDSKVLLVASENRNKAMLAYGYQRIVDAGLAPEGAEFRITRFMNANIEGTAEVNKADGSVDSSLKTLKAALDWCDTLLIMSDNGSLNAKKLEYTNSYTATAYNAVNYVETNTPEKTTIVMSTDTPYDIQVYPNADALMISYGNGYGDPTEQIVGGATGSSTASIAPNVTAGVEVAFGVYGASGKLPITIPKAVANGTGVKYTDEVVFAYGTGFTYNTLVTVNKAKLEVAIEKGEMVNESKFTADSYAVLTKALKDAKDIIKDENATQLIVDNAITDIENAIANLVKATKVSKRVEDMVNNMTLDQKLNQMMMVDFRNWKVEGADKVSEFRVMNDEVREIVEKYNFGSIIFFAENSRETEEIFNLTLAYQKAMTANGGIPTLFTIDQEGGRVNRIGSGTKLPGNMSLGASDVKYSNMAGQIIGSELISLGINSTLAPVVDVNNNPNNPVIGTRSFSDNAVSVGEHASAYIAGLAEYDVIGCAKHFPGHGDTATDSHTGLPVVDKPYESLKEVELKPYEVAIEQGIEMIMTAHILYPQLDDTQIKSNKTGELEYLPATMSKKIINDMLKNQMGFDGVVTTDAMNMAGVADKWDRVQSITLSINAGVDLICMPVSLTSKASMVEYDAVIDGLKENIENGTISMDRIDDAVTRILTLKESKNILDWSEDDYSLDKALATVGGKENKAMEREIAAAGVTVVKNDNNTLPIQLNEDSKVLLVASENRNKATLAFGYQRVVEAGLAPEGADVRVTRFMNANIEGAAEVNKADGSVDESLKTFKDALDWCNVLVIMSDNGSLNAAKLKFENSYSATPYNAVNYVETNTPEKTTVVMSTATPYDIQLFTNADALLITFGNGSGDPTLQIIGGATDTNEASLSPNVSAGIEVAFGVYGAQGKLPITINKAEIDGTAARYTDEVVFAYGTGITYDSLLYVPSYYKENDFIINMVNDVLKTDDGTNVTTMTHQGTYAGLFDGNKANNTARDFELMWDIEYNYVNGALPEYVKLPLTLRFTLKTPDKLNKAIVYNANKANGYVTSAKATAYYVDGTSSSVLCETTSEAYEFEFAEYGKEVKYVDIEILSAVNAADEVVTNMMTISEIELIRYGKSVANVDKDALEAAIERAEAVDTTNKLNATVKALETALTNAKALLANDDATQYDVDQAVNAVDEAIKGLRDKPETDKTILEAAIKAAKDVNKEDYIDASIKALETALTNAEAVLANDEAEQDAVDNATKDIYNAINALTLVADKGALEEAIKAAKDADTTNKTEDSIAALTSAIASAEKVLADRNASQEAVDAAVKALNDAVANLKDIEVKPEYKGYDDVDSDAWYADMVKEATIKGLMGRDGNVGNNFNPDGKITRGMVATVLYRMAGEPKVTYADKFSDVKDGLWYSESIVWASEAKVVSGYANGKFGPDDAIKREDFAIMLRNYANTCGLDTKSNQSLETFKDYKAVSAYAKDAIAWCVENGLMSGSKKGEETYLNPSANTTRAEAAKMFVQLSNLIKK